ncbi:unnamed protein product [Arctogadus glacialis]
MNKYTSSSPRHGGPVAAGLAQSKGFRVQTGGQAAPQQDCTVRGQVVAGAIVECQEWPLNQSELHYLRPTIAAVAFAKLCTPTSLLLVSRHYAWLPGEETAPVCHGHSALIRIQCIWLYARSTIPTLPLPLSIAPPFTCISPLQL